MDKQIQHVFVVLGVENLAKDHSGFPQNGCCHSPNALPGSQVCVVGRHQAGCSRGFEGRHDYGIYDYQPNHGRTKGHQPPTFVFVEQQHVRSQSSHGKGRVLLAEERGNNECPVCRPIPSADGNRPQEKGHGENIAVQVEEDGEDFHTLAREHSLDPKSKYAGGYLGLLPRSALNPEQSAKVFNASPGDVLGPFALEEGYCLVMVEELHKAEMNEVLRDAIKQITFDQWLNEFMKEGVKVVK